MATGSFLKEVEPIDNESDMYDMRTRTIRMPRSTHAAMTCGARPLEKKGMCEI
ncbi:MAG: hypothetical protein KBI06_07955 [Synergistaceae bacterium]|jgi:hypothetical protein|nr:hypothetical protein [Synergistaceae bacterium]